VKPTSIEGVKVFIAGPMESAGGNWNVPLFDFVANKLREHGCYVYNPADQMRSNVGTVELVKAMDPSSRKAVRKDAIRDEIEWILQNAQLLMLLPGWERSTRATAEWALALALGIEMRETGNILLPAEGKTIDPASLRVENLQLEKTKDL